MPDRTDLIPIGTRAPDFTADASDGKTVALAALRGQKRVVLVFYPGDNTPGCTAQLCAIRDSWAGFQAEEIAVYGVNPASAQKHVRFVARQGFPFPLLVDTGNRIAAAYGCRYPLFGIVKRTVYGIDKQGRVIYAQRGAPAPREILAAFAALNGSDTTGNET